jgi:hypothetical protein
VTTLVVASLLASIVALLVILVTFAALFSRNERFTRAIARSLQWLVPRSRVRH